ncbi:hypothetical protein PG994_012784 [Apiospora phragmitis]|uniref:Uncharacterized protein n=1 Tax=Apiospora phragmitis TaxID=2905665 RepID=A0ABR1TBI2_9PEZI
MLSSAVVVELGADQDLGVPELVVIGVVEGGADKPGPGAGPADVGEAVGDDEADGGIRKLNGNTGVVTLGFSVLGSRRIHLDECERLLTSSND